MNIKPEKRLFWFLKENVSLDITEISVLDMYVQQVLTKGRLDDIKQLLNVLKLKRLKESLGRISHYLPREVKDFWEDFIECNN